MAREAGSHIHTLIQHAVRHGMDKCDVHQATRALLQAKPIRSSVAPAVRMRCESGVNTYLWRFAPVGYRLEGVEVDLGGAVADLVWVGPNGQVLIDEVKSGYQPDYIGQLTDQVVKLVTKGTEVYGSLLLGVRVVPIATPRRAWIAVAGEYRVVRGVLPPELKVREMTAR